MEKQTKYKQFVLDFKKADPKIYKNIDLDRLAVYVINILEKNNIPLYYEYIGVALFKMFPEKFALLTFKEYPDMNRIADVLQLNLNPTHRNWATGNIKNGFMLTAAGRQIVDQADNMLKNPGSQKILKSAKLPRMKSVQSDISEMLKSSLYIKWKNNKNNINEFDILFFLGVMSFTSKPIIKKRVNDLKGMARDTDSKEFTEFINYISNFLKL